MGKIVMNNQAYGQAIVGQEGGGTVPECGIVPTEFADNGFVLSADSYGDVMPYALYGSISEYTYSYSYIIRDENVPENIDLTEDWWDAVYPPVGGTTGMIHELTFKTPPTVIREAAFEGQAWMNIEGGLPEGIEEIKQRAFFNCLRLKIDSIPASV